MRVTTHAWLKAHEKSLLHAHVVSLHLAVSLLIIHPSSPRSWLIPTQKSAGPAHFRNGEEDVGYMANMRHCKGFEPNQPDKMVFADDDVTPINNPDHDSIFDFLKTTYENTGWFGVPTVCETSVSQISRGHTALQKESKESLTRESEGKQRMRMGGQRRF